MINQRYCIFCKKGHFYPIIAAVSANKEQCAWCHQLIPKLEQEEYDRLFLHSDPKSLLFPDQKEVKEPKRKKDLFLWKALNAACPVNGKHAFRRAKGARKDSFAKCACGAQNIL